MVEKKLARNSYGGNYACVHEWPESCFVQCGAKGVVFSQKGESYETGFFEAFPKNPDTFIRGEGKTICDAEEDAWKQYQKQQSCDGHDFIRHGDTHGICKKCGLFQSDIIPPEYKCSVCGLEHVSLRSNLNKTERLCCEHYVEEMKSYDDAKNKETANSGLLSLSSFSKKKEARFLGAYLKIKEIKGGDWKTKIEWNKTYEHRMNVCRMIDYDIIDTVFKNTPILAFGLLGHKEEAFMPDEAVMEIMMLALKRQGNKDLKFNKDDAPAYAEWVTPLIEKSKATGQ